MHVFSNRLIGSLVGVGLLLLAISSVSNSADTSGDQDRTVRIRIEWGGGAARLWNGELEIDEGRLVTPISLGVEADEPGTLLSHGNEFHIRRNETRVYDGFDITVIAPPAAMLSFTLHSTGESTKNSKTNSHEPLLRKIRIPLADLDEKPQVISLKDENSRLILRRTPGDVLRFETERPHLIFDPGETLSASVRWNPLKTITATGPAQFEWTLNKARSNTVLLRGSEDVSLSDNNSPNGLLLPLKVRLPQTPGAYEIRYHFSGKNLDSYRSTTQIVITEQEQPPRLDEDNSKVAEKLVDSFQPEEAGFRTIEKQIGQNLFKETIGRFLKSFDRSDENTAKTRHDVQWNAYRLDLDHTGRPHRLIISVPSEQFQKVGISLLEPNAAGQLMPVGIDTGFFLNGEPAATGSENTRQTSIRHEILFWPKVKKPVVLFHDLGSGIPVKVANVEVYEIASLSGTRSKEKPFPQRLVGPYMQKPLLPENFGATQFLDQTSARSLDDWVTFLTASERLCDYLQFTRHNSLMIGVLADGSTIYPSRLLQPTPRYDSGVFFSTGQDPLRKDVLELLYRMFDRNGLVLIPELQFSTPLPALERQLNREGANVRGIELIGRDGKSWRESVGSTRGLAPYYNPLDPRVQQAILEIVRELAERYQQHDAYHGVAVSLGGKGYLQFPGLEWGYDDASVKRFEKATGIKVPSVSGDKKYTTRYEFLTGQVRREWIRWRCVELARFHQQLTQAVLKGKPAAKLILAGSQLKQNKTELRPIRQTSEALSGMGIDFQLHAETPGVVILWPWQKGIMDRSRNPKQTEAQTYQLTSNSFPASRQQGNLFYHPPQEIRIEEFDAISPWQPAYTWLAAQVVPAGIANRERYAHALATHDAQMLFDGGWMISLGQEHHTQEIRKLISRLPAIPFYRSQKQSQPVVVRTAHSRNKTWIYIVNEIEGEMEVTLDLSCSPSTKVRSVSDGKNLSLKSGPKKASRLAFTVDSFGIQAFEFDAESMHVENVNVTPSSRILARIEKHIQSLDRKILEARSSVQTHNPSLKNPGFETVPENPKNIPGWNLSIQNASLWTLDKTNPRSGRSSLMLTASARESTSLSSELELNNSRTVVMRVWLRGNRNDSDVRLILQGKVNGKTQSRSASARVGKQWRRYAFQVRDLPSDTMNDVKALVEVRGPGKVWLDDVEIEMQRLSADDFKELTKVSAAIAFAWQEKRYTDCQQLLSGYWGRFLYDEFSSENSTPKEKPRTASRIRRFFQR